MPAHRIASSRSTSRATRRLVALAGALAWGLFPVSLAVADDKPTTQPANSAGGPTHSTPVESPSDAAPWSLRERIRSVMKPVEVENRPLRQAVQWWSDTTGVPIVVDWDAVERQNVNLEQTVTLKLPEAPVLQVLRMILREGSPDTPMIAQVTPAYVEVMTKAQANRKRVTKLYDVRDLVFFTPTFDAGRPRGLRSMTRPGGGSLYNDRGANRSSPELSRDDRGQNLAQLIRDMVEPEVWAENGGESTIRFFNGHLLIHSPLYVHEQIGTSVSLIRR